MDVSKVYVNLQKRSCDFFSQLFDDAATWERFLSSHNAIEEIELLKDVVEERPESTLLRMGISEYQYALLAISSGMYRHAYISLRLFFEQSLAAVYFSAHEIEYHKWVANAQDITWAALVDANKGVFAKSFLSAFFPGMENYANQYRKLSETVYRECSEFVHGNYHTHLEPSVALEYNTDLVVNWIDRAETVRLCLMFAFTGRYLPHLSKGGSEKIEHIVLDYFGHIGCVQELYGK